jgi:HlyD family type I secretion membrane fusion protein
MSVRTTKTVRVPPTNARPAIIFGLAVILFGVGTFCVWATTVDLSSAIIGSGIVKVVSDRKKVQAQDGGTVHAINVKNGQRVKVGDVLIRLDQTKEKAALDVIQGNYDLAQATVARLEAERSGADDIRFPQDMLSRASVPDVADILAGQRQLFQVRRQTLTGQVDLIRAQIRQLKEQIQGLAAQSKAAVSQIAINQSEHADLSQLLKKNLISRSRVLELEREAAQLEGKKNDFEAQIAAAEAQIAQANLQILQQRMTFVKDVNDELGKEQSNLFTLAQQLLDARHTLDQKTIRATASGIVVGLDIHTVGGVVESGATLLEIVPIEDNLVIEARIRPTDIDNVSSGMKADVVFPGLPRREMPRLTGTVTYVSADAMTDQRTAASYFVANISLSHDERQKLNGHPLLPGMPAEVYIKTGEQTPFAYLTQPFQESFQHAWREP